MTTEQTLLPEQLVRQLAKFIVDGATHPHKAQIADGARKLHDAMINLDHSRRSLLGLEDNCVMTQLSSVTEDLNREASHLYIMIRNLQQITQGRRRNQRATRQPNFEEMIREVRQIEREFEHIAIDMDEKSIRVVTDDIILTCSVSDQTVNFGPFEIKIELTPQHSRNNRKFQYKIKALQPNYPLSERGKPANRCHVHPHINAGSRSLCEGAGSNSITHAMNNHLIADTLLIINAILHEYNPRSPFHKMEGWEYGQCSICSLYVQSDNNVPCSFCGKPMCATCAAERKCSVCGKYICPQHTGNRAVTKCTRCGEVFCVLHYGSIRKHNCVSEMRAEQILHAEETAQLIDFIAQARTLPIVISKPEAPRPRLKKKRAPKKKVRKRIQNEVVQAGFEGSEPTLVTPAEDTGPTGFLDD